MSRHTHVLIDRDGQQTAIARVLLAIPVAGGIDIRQLDDLLGSGKTVIDPDNPHGGYAVQNAMRVLHAAGFYTQHDGFAHDGTVARVFRLTDRGMAVRNCVLSCEEQIKRGAQPAASWGVQRVTVRGSACPQVETYFEVGGE